MHADHQVFLDAIAAKRRLTVRFFSKKEGRELIRTCAPLDYGPLRGSVDPEPRYQLWDLEGKRKPLNLPLVASDIVSMAALEDTFEPADIITWAFKPNAWAIPRDWAEFT
jgi:hypothetical protein